MHSAVMQNKKYVEFAKENTIEVLALQRLDEAVGKKDPKAKAYKTKGPDGQEATYMVEWPNLTYQEILALNRSPAGGYNKSGGIPYTSLVDPWTLEEVEKLPRSAKGIMDAVEAYRKKMTKEHGKGMSRKDLAKVTDTEGDVAGFLKSKEYSKAADALAKISSGKEMPEAFAKRLEVMRTSITEAAQAELAEMEATAGSDAAKAKKDLPGLINRLRGTGLEEKAKALQKSLASG